MKHPTGNSSANDLNAQPEAASGARASAPGATTDAALCNTASDKCKGEEKTFRVVWQGLDTVQFSFPGTLDSKARSELEKRKKLAQSQSEEHQAHAQFEAGGLVFAVLDKGVTQYPYLLDSPRYFIKLSRSEAKSRPLAFVQVKSAHLTSAGPVAALGELQEVLASLGVLEGGETVSRADTALDFVAPFDFASIKREHWVTRARHPHAYWDGDEFSGWVIGEGGDVLARLYNKVLQIISTGKGVHAVALWEASDPYYAPWDRPWRLEFEIKRATLRALGIKSLDDLLGKLDALWQYMTADYLRLTVPSSSDETKSRWPNNPLWDQLAGIAWGTDSQRLSRLRVTNGAPSDDWFAREVAKVVSSYMARENIEDPKLATAHLLKIAYEKLGQRELLYGASVEDIFRIKAAAKARKYGTRLNPQEKVDKLLGYDAALEYLKATGRG